jgi:hypothetical protein
MSKIANQIAISIINNVSANPAFHFDTKNVTVQNLAKLIDESLEREEPPKYRANFLWKDDGTEFEQEFYEFANGSVEEYLLMRFNTIRELYLQEVENALNSFKSQLATEIGNTAGVNSLAYENLVSEFDVTKFVEQARKALYGEKATG